MNSTNSLSFSLFKLVFKDLDIPVQLIGSRAMGCPGPNSDWDYLIEMSYINTIRDYLVENNIKFTENTENKSIKMDIACEGIYTTAFILNICFVPAGATYQAWLLATEVIKCAPFINKLNKRNRIAWFCQLVELFGGEASRYPNYCSKS